MAKESHAQDLEAELYSILFGRMAVFQHLERAAVDALWIGNVDDDDDDWVSPRFWEILGYEEVPVELEQRSWRSVADHADLQTFDAAVRASTTAGSTVCEMVRFRHADGREVATEVHAVVCESDRVPGLKRLVGFHKDLNRELQLQQLLDATNRVARIGAWSWHVATGEIQWTRMVYEILEIDDPDYKPELATGINFYREGHSRETMQRVIQKCLADGEPWDVSLEIVTARNDIRWVRAVGHTELHEGKTVRIFGSLQDIHEQKLRDVQLAQSESLLSSNFALAPNGMVIADQKGTIERVNKAFADMLGVTTQELLGRSFVELMPEEVQQKHLRLFERFADQQLNLRRFSTHFTSREGQMVWADVAMAAVRDDAEQLRKFSIQVVDTTEARVAEENRVRVAFLEDKAREMEQFAYIASHDLRQPVLTIKGYLDVLEEDYGEVLEEAGRGYLKVMTSALSRMDAMMRGILDYSRLSQARTLEQVDLNEVVADVLIDIETLRQEQQGRVEIDALPCVWGHQVELRQLFQNLITNALKFSRSEQASVVQVKSKSVRGGYAFEVTDNGVGIEPHDQERIFGLFQRGAHTAIDVAGSGIGLATCKTIVERHGGEIAVASTPGGGSTFTFTILTDRFR